MSSDEVQNDEDELKAEEGAIADEKDLDAVLIGDEDESSGEDEEDDDSEEEDDGEETGDEEAEDDDEIENCNDTGDEGASEEDNSVDEDDEEDGSDDGEEGDEEEDEQVEEVDNADSSSGDENSDRCPICLNRLRNQDIGTPETCDHSFCLECIQEWAKNVNTCPVDRQVFQIILARHADEDKIFKKIPVENHQQEEEEAEEDPTYCEVCGQSNREDRLLLCDRCDLGYHCDCLDPPLASVPVHEWFCPDCQQSRNAVDSEQHSSGRQIARTRVSERVRRLIAEARAERAERRKRIAAMIEAQEAHEEGAPTPGSSASATTVSLATARKKKTTTRKRKTSRKKTTRKKTAKKRKTKRKTTGKKTKTRRKRKSKGKGKRKIKKTRKSFSSTSSPALARTATFRAVTSVKGRIADKLGLSKPPAGRSIPMQKNPQSGTRQEGAARSSIDHGQSTFSLLGSKDELYLFADHEGEERQPINRPAIPAENLLSRSAKSSHKPLSFSSTKKKVLVKESPTATSTVSAATGRGFDLLGSIMQNQDLLHKGSKHVTINRDGSLSAASRSTALSRTTTVAKSIITGISASTSSTQLSSTETRNSHCVQNSSASASPSETKSEDSTPPSKLEHSKIVSVQSPSASDSETTVKSEPGSEVQHTLSDSSNRPSSLQADLNADDVSKYSEATSSDEELPVVDPAANLQVEVKKENSDNSDGSISSVKSNILHSETSISSSPSKAYVEGTPTFSAVKSEGEADISAVVNVAYGINHENDYKEEDCYSSKSSSENAGLINGTTFGTTFANAPVTQQDIKPLTGSESSSNGIDHNLSINNSPEIGSRESDSVLTPNINDSSRLHAADVNSGVDLEADAVFSNNARLNAEEDAGNNSIGFSTTTSSQANLRNFAAVASDLNSVHDDSSVGIMKRNFDLLVSTSSNLAGYESGEENDNVQTYMHHPYDREEGEASDSNEEGDVREYENKQRTEDDQEEGEIVDEEERERWAVGRNRCDEEDHEDSGGLDVNAIHIEEMEIGTFRKRSMSQNEDNNNEGCKKVKQEEDTAPDKERKMDNESEEQEDNNEDDLNTGKPVTCSFMISSLLTSLKTNEFVDGNNEEKGEEEEQGKEEEEKEKEDLAMKTISILDFIGDASAKKFGLQTVDKDKGRLEQSADQTRGGASFAGGNNFGYRGSRPYKNRRQNSMQRDRRDDVDESLDEAPEVAAPRSFDRRRGSWQEEDRGRQRSGSRDSPAGNQRSGLNETRSLKSHHGREAETGRRKRDSESRDRSWRSRSRSDSPRRRAEKRRRGTEHEEKGRHGRRGKKSRWNNEDEEHVDNNVEENVVKKDEKVEQKHESSDPSTTHSNGYPHAAVPDISLPTSGHYQPHQYPTGLAVYSYPGSHVPPPPHHHGPPRPNHPHAAHPAMPFSHSASLGQPPYSQAQHRQPVQYTAQNRPHPPESKPQPRHGFPTYYPPPHLSNVLQKAPPPPPHPYPHAVYPGAVHYSSQPGTNLGHHNPHMSTTNQPHSGYPRYPHAMAHPPYPQSMPHATYPPRPVAPSTALPAVYTSTTAASVYPPQPPLLPASSTPAVPRYSYPAVKQEPSVPHTAATTKQESTSTTVSNPPPTASHHESQKRREAIKESSPSDMKTARASYHISPPAAPIKGVTTYDKVDSSILLNEVKKGFRQLVEDAVRCGLKGAWSSKKITKEEYKDIFKRAVEKVCGSKETVVHQEKIQSLVNAYVIKARRGRKPLPTSN